MSTGLGQRIKQRRIELNLSQEELAARMNLKSKSTICKIERGEDNLTTDTVRKYAEALETTPAYLMGWKEPNEESVNVNKYGLRLKELREKNGYTQDALADKLHTTRSCVANYEQGIRQPDFEMQKSIANIFNASIDYLFGRDEASETSSSPNKTKTAIEIYDRIMSLSPEDQTAILTLLESLQKKL